MTVFATLAVYIFCELTMGKERAFCAQLKAPNGPRSRVSERVTILPDGMEKGGTEGFLVRRARWVSGVSWFPLCPGKLLGGKSEAVLIGSLLTERCCARVSPHCHRVPALCGSCPLLWSLNCSRSLHMHFDSNFRNPLSSHPTVCLFFKGVRGVILVF